MFLEKHLFKVKKVNYFGQGTYLMTREGQVINENPFFLIMPEWFVLPGIIIATTAAIIASQALISGSFTLVSQYIKFNKNKPILSKVILIILQFHKLNGMELILV